jgi:hypothetical protein
MLTMVHRPDYEMGMERKLNLSRQWSAARTNKVLLHVKLDNGALARLTSPSHLLPCDQHQHSCQFGSVVVIQSLRSTIKTIARPISQCNEKPIEQWFAASNAML